MSYDVIVIGAGLSGLTAAALLAKRGVSVAVIDRNYMPGGSCGIFKRNGTIFEQGAAMLYGFGEKGFNAHRFVFNCLEEPVDMIRHEKLYCVNYNGHRIVFHSDINQFVEELSKVFPKERENIKRFYQDMNQMYQHVMVEVPSYETADEADKTESLKKMIRHPVSYAKFLGFLNQSAESLLKKYFTSPDIFSFFDKMTSTYCYATVKEAPAILAAIMFIDNHVGGSYYPAGSTLFLTGKLEKVIEQYGGTMLYEQEVNQILIKDGIAEGVSLTSGELLYASHIIYSGNVWELYGKLIDEACQDPKRHTWAMNQTPTYPSVALYALVEREAIPKDTLPIEMLVGNPQAIDESEITCYLMSIDDQTLCDDRYHVLEAIGPSFLCWKDITNEQYQQKKQAEINRLLGVLETRFPNIKKHIVTTELATPKTIERYTGKPNGAVAGPKQMLGQHMFHRLHIRTEWKHLYCCGESTVMGTGTPTVTTSGISAANAVLMECGLDTFRYEPNQKNYVTVHKPPYQKHNNQSELMRYASQCQFCEHPCCCVKQQFDIRQIMRRAAVGNVEGARKQVVKGMAHELMTKEKLLECEKRCIMAKQGKGVQIRKVIELLT